MSAIQPPTSTTGRLSHSGARMRRPVWMTQAWVPHQYGKAPYFWLLSFAMFGWRYLQSPPGVAEWAGILLSLILFLPAYFYSFWADEKKLIACIMLSACLSYVWAPVNVGSSSFLIFSAAMCARFSSERRAYLAVGVLLSVTMLVSLAFQFSVYFWMPALIFSVPCAVGSVMGERQLKTNQLLARKQEEVEFLAAVAERERIARDLHDLLGHSLSLITLKAALAKKLLSRDVTACQQELQDIEDSARLALSEVRAAVTGYRITGFEQELQSAHKALAAAHIRVETEIDLGLLPKAAENIICFALREAVTNVLRHSQSSLCKIQAHTHQDQLYLHINDDGFREHPTPPPLKLGSGLRGMRERVEAYGGQWRAFTQQGLHIDIQLPL